MIEKEPQISSEREPEEEEEQTPEQILSALEFAAENEFEARLTVLSLDGKSSITAMVSPVALEKDVLWITTESGEGMAVELHRIKKVELPSEPEEER